LITPITKGHVMTFRPLPSKRNLTVCFAHGVYQMAERFAARNTGIRCFQVRTLADLEARVSEADVVVVSMLWRNALLETATRLAYVQSISAGLDQYDSVQFQSYGVRLASGAGVNANAVAEHAMGLILALKRHIHTGRDYQARGHWRPMIADIAQREDELGGKTMVIVGMGRIGSRLAHLARAFDVHVIGVKRDTSVGGDAAHEVVETGALNTVLPRADIVVLTCPLTPETTNLIDTAALALMKPMATLINVARGKVVDEDALIAVLKAGRLAAAGLDVTRDEPLPPASPLWAMPNVLITPHTAGETQHYEDNVIDILLDNLDRQWRGDTELRNAVV
jgi:D-2-hydroxyacid dehydrogenase (NADP+)